MILVFFFRIWYYYCFVNIYSETLIDDCYLGAPFYDDIHVYHHFYDDIHIYHHFYDDIHIYHHFYCT